MGERTEFVESRATTAVEIAELKRRVSALESRKSPAVQWLTVNGKWLIMAVLALLLALMGWGAADIRGLVG